LRTIAQQLAATGGRPSGFDYLRLGLSMHTDVNIRNQDGALLAAAPPAKPLLTTDAYAKQIAEAEARIEQIVRANLGRRG